MRYLPTNIVHKLIKDNDQIYFYIMNCTKIISLICFKLPKIIPGIFNILCNILKALNIRKKYLQFRSELDIEFFSFQRERIAQLSSEKLIKVLSALN